MEYYQLTFYRLLEERRREIDDALHSKPQAFRKAFFSKCGPLRGDDSILRPVAECYLAEIERALANILSRHSVEFWVHLYRRIGPQLSPLHPNKTDPMTTSWVREIVEVAISKYGTFDDNADMGVAGRIAAFKILGGQYSKDFKRLKKLARKRGAETPSVQLPNQIVITKFSARDYEAIYYVEGLAYEFWRTMALLRATGKGAQASINENGDVEYQISAELDALLTAYDRRIENEIDIASIIGTRIAIGTASPSDGIILCAYNVGRVAVPDEVFSAFGVQPATQRDSKTNFLCSVLSARDLFDSHKYLEDAFTARYGFSLSSLIKVINAATDLVIVGSAKKDGVDPVGLFRSCFVRGYRVLEIPIDKISEAIYAWCQQKNNGLTEETVRAVVAALTLPNDRSPVALWTRGPRFLFSPLLGGTRIDLNAIIRIIETVSFGLRDDGAVRSKEFEKFCKDIFEKDGFDVLDVDKIYNPEGKERQIDAAVRIGTELYLGECISMGRPLDFEIGKPKTISMRQAEMGKKLDQVASLVQFVRADPRGKNYDFSWATRVDGFVLSPFVEWIWDTANCLWIDEVYPRIMAPREAQSYLNGIRQRMGRVAS